MLKKTIAVYSLPALFILAWWTAAFQPQKTKKNTFIPKTNSFTVCSQTPIIRYLNPIQRNSLKEALAGNTELMSQLIASWDAEAQVLESLGIEGIRRLPNHDFVLTQKMGIDIKNEPAQNSLIPCSHLSLPDKTRRFLPQSYVSACILLALLPPSQIVSLPQGLREQTQFFPSARLEQITQDSSRFNSEALYKTEPDAAFVASYSHPASVEALENQGITLYLLEDIRTQHELKNVLEKIGVIVDKPLHAKLLSSFIEASCMAMSNHLAVFRTAFPDQEPKKILYLNRHERFSLPSPRSPTGHLLQELGINTFLQDTLFQGEMPPFCIPLDQETITLLNPDLYIISAEDPNSGLTFQGEVPDFLQKKPVFFVDEVVQNSPTQFYALAYFDLYAAILKAYFL